MGADRAIHVVTDEHTLPLHVAKVLKALVQREEPQMVILGKQAQPSAAPPPSPDPKPCSTPVRSRHRRSTTTATKRGRCLPRSLTGHRARLHPT